MQGPKHVVLAINTKPILVVFRLHYPIPSYYMGPCFSETDNIMLKNY